MKNKISIFFGVLILMLISFWSGMFVKAMSNSYKSEQVIAKEITLLEKYNSIPDCEEIKESAGELREKKFGEELIIWKYNKETKQLKKIIVDDALDIAYEEKTMNCK